MKEKEIKNKVQIFKKGNHKIIWSDCIEALKSVEDNSVDLIFADPPYNIGKNFNGRKDKYEHNVYLEWCYEWLELCIKKLKQNGSLYVMTSTQYMPYFDIFLRNKLHILGRLIWSYDSSGVLLRTSMTKSIKSIRTKYRSLKLKCLNTQKQITITKLLLLQCFLWHAEQELYLKKVLT